MMIKQTILLAAFACLAATAQTTEAAPFTLPTELRLASNVTEYICIIAVAPAGTDLSIKENQPHCDVYPVLSSEAYYITAVPDNATRAPLEFHLFRYETILAKWHDEGIGVFLPRKQLWLDMLFLNLRQPIKTAVSTTSETIHVRVYLGGSATREVPVAVLVMPPVVK